MHLHATVSLWQREHEDGSYHAEKNGWKLRVSWHPEPAPGKDGKPRGYTWKAEGPDGKKAESPESIEEIELAMAEAERATGAPPPAEGVPADL